MFNTIRKQLLLLLLLFILVTLTASLTLFNYFEKKKDSLSQITLKAEKIHLLLQQDINISHNFIENETINPAYFVNGRSQLYQQHDSIWTLIDAELDHLYVLQYRHHFGLDDSLAKLKSKFLMYRLFTEDIHKKSLIRGFKDFGVEGRMRVYAHTLESYQQEIGLVDLLQLRRHEKDFIIRQEDSYIKKHQDLIKQVRERIETNKQLPAERRHETLKLLAAYAEEFENLVMSEKMLGLKSGKGLKKQIDDVSSQIVATLVAIVNFSAQQEAAAVATIRSTYFITGGLFVVIAIAAALFITRYVSRNTRALQQEMDEFVKSGFTRRSTLANHSSTDEIAKLQRNFTIMEQHIVDQMNALRTTNQDLETLFYVSSHGMRQPLMRLKELLGEALNRVWEPKARMSLHQIEKSWAQMTALVDELGLITRVKHSPIQTETIDLKELIRSVYTDFKGLPGFDDIVFSMDIRSKRPLYSSAGLLRTAFRNLLENSIKYATKRSSFSFIKVLIVDHNEEMLRIEISDNGIGIQREFHEQIFTMFFRGTDKVQGTGIGLYVAQSAIEKLNGAIGVESDGSNGTTFTILLPRQHHEKALGKKALPATEPALA